MIPADWLRFAYGTNILILVPVCWAMLDPRGVERVFQGAVTEAAGLRLLVFSLWAAILMGSLAGLAWPRMFAPLLLVQIVYKSLWLALFVVPQMLAGGQRTPTGIAVCFVAIIATYPFIFWFGFVKA